MAKTMTDAMTKTMSRYGLSVIFAIGLSLSANAANAANTQATDGEFFAFRFAQLLNRADTAEQLAQRLPLAPRDLEALKEQLKKDGPFVAPQIKEAGNAEVTMTAQGHIVVIGFKDILQKRVFVDHREIELTSEKNFLNYRSEVLAILKTGPLPKSAWWGLLLPEAHAAASPAWYETVATMTADGLDAIWTHVLSVNPEKMMQPLARDRLATDIIDAYETDEHIYNEGLYGGVKDEYAPLVFRCEKNQLQRLGRANGVDAQNHIVIAHGLTRTGPQRFSFAAPMRSPDAQLDQNFTVLQPGGRLLKGQNLTYVEEDYGRFPIIAQECCAMKGCYEKVLAGIQPQLHHAAKTSRGANTSVQ